MADEKKKSEKKAAVDQEVIEVGKSKSAVATKEPQKSAFGWRLAAILLWLLGVGGTVLSIIMILEGNDRLLYVGLGIMAVASIVGGLLWKKANRIRPCTVKQDGSTKSKILTFLWNQMGAVATFVIFLPAGLVLLLKGDKLSAKGKRIAVILTVVLLALSTVITVDYDPPVAEELNDEELIVAEDYVAPEGADVPAFLEGHLDYQSYWTRYGYAYHLDRYCSSISRSLTIYTGSIADAFEADRLKACSFCVSEDYFEDYDDTLDDAA